MALLGLGDLAGALLSDNNRVALESLSDDSLLGILGMIDGLGAAPAAKDKARKKVFNAIKHKSKNINRETKDLTAKALFEQRLAQLPAEAQAKLRSGQWQLVPFIYYAVKDISGQNHADLFKSGDNTVIGITNVVQGRMPAEDYFLCTKVRCVTSQGLTGVTEADLKGAIWDKPAPAVINGEWKMGQESTVYIDKSAASVFSHDGITTLANGEFELDTPKMFYPQRTINVEFDFAGAPAANTAMRFELYGVKTTKA